MNRAGILAWTSALHGHSKFLSQVFQVRFWCCKKQIWSTLRVDWDGILKIEDDLKNEDNLKDEDDLNDEDDLKNEDYLKKVICPPI